LPFQNFVKDIRVLIKPDASTSVDVDRFNVRLNNHLYMSISGLMAHKIIPRQFYEIENTEDIYYIPFCHDPNAIKEKNTSQINLNRSQAQLDVFIAPGRYTIHIMSQYYSIMQNGKSRVSMAHAHAHEVK
jgi:hypothetical protein